MLPTEMTKPKQRLSDQSILLYGPSKIGKSTFCSQAKNAIFLATEPGLNSLEVYQIQITSWDIFLNACKDLSKPGHKFETIIIDTVNNLYKLCSDHICKSLGVTHPADLGHGKGFGLINDELLRVLTKLSFLPQGLILVSHSQEVQIDAKIKSRTRIVPNLPGKARETVEGLVDLILFCDFELNDDGGYNRVIRTKPHEDYDAGDRTAETIRIPETIPLDYAEFAKYFDSKDGKNKNDNKTKTKEK